MKKLRDNRAFASPNHVKRFKNLISEGFYDGLSFYRVIDGFVAQGGLHDGSRETIGDGIKCHGDEAAGD